MSVGTGRKSTFSAECGTREEGLCMGGCVCGRGPGGKGGHMSGFSMSKMCVGGASFQEENKNRRELFSMTHRSCITFLEDGKGVR